MCLETETIQYLFNEFNHYFEIVFEVSFSVKFLKSLIETLTNPLP